VRDGLWWKGFVVAVINIMPAGISYYSVGEQSMLLMSCSS